MDTKFWILNYMSYDMSFKITYHSIFNFMSLLFNTQYANQNVTSFDIQFGTSNITPNENE